MYKRTTKRSLQVLYIVAALFILVMTLQLFDLHPQVSAQDDGINFSLTQSNL